MDPESPTDDTLRAAEVLDVGLDGSPSIEIRLDEAIRRGLSFDALQSLLDRAGLTLGEVAAPLRIQPRTLTRRKREGKLTTEESDRLFRLVRVFAHVELVLGDRVKALQWLRSENRSLGGRVPWKLIDTDIGVSLVHDALGRIEHGVFA